MAERKRWWAKEKLQLLKTLTLSLCPGRFMPPVALVTLSSCCSLTPSSPATKQPQQPVDCKSPSLKSPSIKQNRGQIHPDFIFQISTEGRDILPVSKMDFSCLSVSFTNAMPLDPSLFLFPAWQHKCCFPKPTSTSHPQARRSCEGSRLWDCRGKVSSSRPPKASLTPISWHRSQDVIFLTVSPAKLIKEMKIPPPFITADKGPATSTELPVLLLLHEWGGDPVHSCRATMVLSHGATQSLCAPETAQAQLWAHAPGGIAWVTQKEAPFQTLKSKFWKAVHDFKCLSSWVTSWAVFKGSYFHKKLKRFW